MGGNCASLFQALGLRASVNMAVALFSLFHGPGQGLHHVVVVPLLILLPEPASHCLHLLLQVHRPDLRSLGHNWYSGHYGREHVCLLVPPVCFLLLQGCLICCLAPYLTPVPILPVHPTSPIPILLVHASSLAPHLVGLRMLRGWGVGKPWV